MFINPPRPIQCLASLYDHRFDPKGKSHVWHTELRKLLALQLIDKEFNITRAGIAKLEEWHFPVGKKEPL